MTIAIITAMTEEATPLRNLLKPQILDKIGHLKIEKTKIRNEDIILLESGIGKANAAMGTSLAIERFSPRIILNFGVVGSLKEDIGLGDLVIANDFIYSDADDTAFGSNYGRVPRMPDSYPLHPDLKDYVDKLLKLESDFRILSGQVTTSDAFLYEEDRINWVKKTFPQGLVNEMEATAIAQVAYTFDLPFLAIKIPTDASGPNSPKEYEERLDKASAKGAELFVHILEDLVQKESLP